MVTTTDQEVVANNQKTRAQGIDVRKALEILAARSCSHDHHNHAAPHNNHSTGCIDILPTEDAVQWGQRISLGGPQDTDDEEKETMAASISIEEQKERIAKERAERQIVMEQKLASMSVVELLQCVMNAQEERVATYRNYNK